MKKLKILSQFLLISVFLGACLPTVPTIQDPQAMIATNAAATLAAMPTFTPRPTNTATPRPTVDAQSSAVYEAAGPGFATATPIPSLTPLFAVETSIFSGTPSGTPGLMPFGPAKYACKELLTKPDWEEKILQGQPFQAVWKVQNIGSEIWYIKQVELFFISSEYIKPKDAVVQDIPFNVWPNTNIRFAINMEAPQTPGKYSAVWGLRTETGTFCTVTFKIEVIRRAEP